MPRSSKEANAAYMREYYANNPEALERKRRADRERYQRNRQKVLNYQREYYEKNGDTIRARISLTGKLQRAQRRLEAIEQLGGKCQDCGNENLVVLQFHHRPGTFKVAEVTSLGNSKKRFWEEVVKCDLVCANCHLIRHEAEGEG